MVTAMALFSRGDHGFHDSDSYRSFESDNYVEADNYESKSPTTVTPQYTSVRDHIQPVLPPSPSKPVSPARRVTSPTQIETCNEEPFWGGFWSNVIVTDTATPNDDALSDSIRQVINKPLLAGRAIERDCKDVSAKDINTESSGCRIS